MENKEFDLIAWMRNKTVEMIRQMSDYQNIPFDKSKAIEYLGQTNRARYAQIIKQVREEQEEADKSIFGHIPSMRSQIFTTNLTHALLQYAKEVLNHAKIDQEATIV
jgi:hypothetical protein